MRLYPQPLPPFTYVSNLRLILHGTITHLPRKPIDRIPVRILFHHRCCLGKVSLKSRQSIPSASDSVALLASVYASMHDVLVSLFKPPIIKKLQGFPRLLR
jgi:hypothetical protein